MKNSQDLESTSTPDVMFIEDLVKMLRVSRATIDRRRKSNSFPIPELPSFDNRPRWSRAVVERYLAKKQAPLD